MHDALLHTRTPPTSHLRAIVSHVRRATPVPARLVSELREALVGSGWHAGKGQHDVTELLTHLLDVLHAPYIPLWKRLVHSAPSEPDDTAPFTERVLWLDPAKGDVSVAALLDRYFFDEVLDGLNRGGGKVSARVYKTLFPFYTPLRETGESVSATRSSFDALLIPLALNRYRQGVQKNTTSVHLPTAIPAMRYVQPGTRTPAYTLMLRSVICHLGSRITSGHYVTYTYHPTVGWRRWDDLQGGVVKSVRGDVGNGLPENQAWRNEICQDSYLVFYELVPGDGEEKWRRQDESVARHLQVEEDFRSAFCESVKGMLDLSPVSVRGG